MLLGKARMVVSHMVTIMFFPYLYFVRAFSFVRDFTSGRPPYTAISEGLYVGGWPYAPDKLPPGNPAIIDCTCELPRKKEFSGHAYCAFLLGIPERLSRARLRWL
ncbi:UNVERIFIED_CONTAM: hypothetical protein Sradi_6229200 [Sesamum radiatum]|uniref:Uncharacterized protein n=1 Tax=Sesamum radiatum TaxID=300843 RepID=A0AAW2KBV8_SESRA